MESRQVSSIYEATSAFRRESTLWCCAIQIVKKKFQFGRVRPAGAMVNAFAYGAKDSRFESWVGRKFLGVLTSKMHFTLLEFGYYEVIGPKHRILRGFMPGPARTQILDIFNGLFRPCTMNGHN